MGDTVASVTLRPSDDRYLPQVVASVIAIFLTLGIFVVVTSKDGRPVAIYNSGIGDHWPVDHRTLTIVDRTDDPNWHQAVLAAVATWEAGGSALHFIVETGSGACHHTDYHIEYCQATSTQIAKVGSDGDQGLFEPDVGHDNEYKSAILLVCSNCGIDQNRRVIIATHELGHSLGLAHSPDPFSVMYFSGGSTQPDSRDYQILRQLEGTAAPQG